VGRKSRLKRQWRLERLAERVEAGEYEPARPEPLSDMTRSAWIVATAASFGISTAAIGTSQQLRFGLLPVVLLSLGSAYFERRRGRPRAGRLWLLAGIAWWAALAWLPPRVLMVLRESIAEVLG
jgi:hypothetical protein